MLVNRKGFTLIELLAVITILAIIAMITIPAINGIVSDSRYKACEEQVRVIERAANSYYNDNIKTITSDSVNVATLYQKGYIEKSDLKNPINGNSLETEEVEFKCSGSYKLCFKMNSDICAKNTD